MWKRLTIPALAVLAFALFSLRPWAGLRAQQSRSAGASVFDPSVRTLLIRYDFDHSIAFTGCLCSAALAEEFINLADGRRRCHIP